MVALDDSEPMFFFAGAWTPWHGVRAVKEGVIHVDIFSFFTTDANSVVKPIHEKAMPVILRTAEEVKAWLTEEAPIALKLQKPLPDDALIVLQLQLPRGFSWERDLGRQFLISRGQAAIR